VAYFAEGLAHVRRPVAEAGAGGFGCPQAARVRLTTMVRLRSRRHGITSGPATDPHGAYWKTTPQEVPVFGPDGSCTYVARDGRRRFVADPASLFSPPIERTRNGPLYDAVARAARGLSELLAGLRQHSK
jgi:hypothetical protein